MTRKLVTRGSRLLNINSHCVTNLHFEETLSIVKRSSLLTKQGGPRTKLTFLDYNQQDEFKSEDSQQSEEDALKTKDSSKHNDPQSIEPPPLQNDAPTLTPPLPPPLNQADLESIRLTSILDELDPDVMADSDTDDDRAFDLTRAYAALVSDI